MLRQVLALDTSLFVSMFDHKLPGILEAEDAIFAAMSFALQYEQSSTCIEKGGRAGRLFCCSRQSYFFLNPVVTLAPKVSSICLAPSAYGPSG